MKTKTMNKIALALGIVVVLPFVGMQFHKPEPIETIEVVCPFTVDGKTINYGHKCDGHTLEVW